MATSIRETVTGRHQQLGRSPLPLPTSGSTIGGTMRCLLVGDTGQLIVAADKHERSSPGKVGTHV
jgi:hypothetical protein